MTVLTRCFSVFMVFRSIAAQQMINPESLINILPVSGPTSVTLVGSPSSEVGDQVTFRCSSLGGNPPPKISWIINERVQTDGVETSDPKWDMMLNQWKVTSTVEFEVSGNLMTADRNFADVKCEASVTAFGSEDTLREVATKRMEIIGPSFFSANPYKEEGEEEEDEDFGVVNDDVSTEGLIDSWSNRWLSSTTERTSSFNWSTWEDLVGTTTPSSVEKTTPTAMYKTPLGRLDASNAGFSSFDFPPPPRSTVNPFLARRTSIQTNSVMMNLAKSLTNNLQRSVKGQQEAIKSIAQNISQIEVKMRKIESDVSTCNGKVSGMDGKIGTLAHRLFALEEQRHFDESLLVFNTIVCNASIELLRQEFVTALRSNGFHAPQDQGNNNKPVETILSRTNALLEATDKKYNDLNQLVVSGFEAIDAVSKALDKTVQKMNSQSKEIDRIITDLRNDFKTADKDASQTSMQQGSDLFDELTGMNEELERIAVSQSEQAVRQTVIESRMNAIENLVFNVSVEMTSLREREEKPAEISDPLDLASEMKVKMLEEEVKNLKGTLFRQIEGLQESMTILQHQVVQMEPQKTAHQRTGRTSFQPTPPAPKLCKPVDPSLWDWCDEHCSRGDCPPDKCICK